MVSKRSNTPLEAAFDRRLTLIFLVAAMVTLRWR
jgi:hypothetical protein